MKRITIFILMMIASSTLLPMDQAIVTLKANLLEDRFANHTALLALAGKESGDNVFHFIAVNCKLAINAPLIKEFVARGVDINLKNRNGKTPIALAVENGNKRACEQFYVCGSSDSIEPLLQKSIHLLLAKSKQAFHLDTANLLGRLWYDQQRKNILMTLLLSFKRISIFPPEIEQLILSRLHKSCIPSNCLPRFFDDNDKILKIYRKRCCEANELIRTCVELIDF